jgi:general secretion pathway protein J
VIRSDLDNPVHREAGFTLTEVLVALALVGLLTGALFGSIRFGLKTWERTTSRSAMLDQNIAVQDFLRRTVGAAYPLFVEVSSSDSRVDFSGTESSISFIGPTPVSRALGGRSRFVVSLEQVGNEKTLTVVSQSTPVAEAEVSKVRDTLLTRLESIEFSYYGEGVKGELEWHGNWISRVMLPQMIRIRAKFPAGDTRSWPELVITPRIDVDVSCVYDALTKQCKGR